MGRIERGCFYFIKSLKNLCGIANTIYSMFLGLRNMIQYTLMMMMMMMLRFTQRGCHTYYHINMGVEVTMIFSLFELM